MLPRRRGTMTLMERTPQWPGRDPQDPEDVLVQVSVRMPYWYKQRILDSAPPHMTAASIMLDLCGRHVSPIK